MPTVQNNLPSTAVQTTNYQTASHKSGLQSASLDTVEVVETDEQAAFATGETVRRVQGRYSVSTVGVKSALKVHAVWIIVWTLYFASVVAWRAAHHQPITQNFVVGEALDKLAYGLAYFYIVTFKGRTNKAWGISWLLRFTLFFASFSVSEVARHNTWDVPLSIFGAFVWSTGSILWQYVKQANADKKREVGNVNTT